MLRKITAVSPLLIVLILLGCADARHPSFPQTPVIEPSMDSEIFDAPVAKPPPPAERYEENRPVPILSEREQKWFDLAARAAGKTPCILDGALVEAARRHVHDLRSGAISRNADAMDHLRHSLHLAGAKDYSVRPYRIRSSDDGATRFSEFVATGHEEWTHCGLGAPDGVSEDTAIWIGVRRAVEISPVPTWTTKNSRIGVSVKTLRPGLGLDAWLEYPDGHVKSLRVIGGKNESLHLTLSFSQTGRFVFELLVDEGDGLETAVLIPVFVDVPVDIRPTVLPTPDAEVADTPQSLLSLINFARARAGVSPLIRDARLDAIAREHCLDMASSNSFGHYSARTGFLHDRLKARALHPSAFSENVARSSGVFRAHANLMRSPSHKIRIVNPDYTHAGVGVLRNGSDVLVTEIFVRW